MSNNLSPGRGDSRGQTISADTTSRELWDQKNKKKEYSQIVKSPKSPHTHHQSINASIMSSQNSKNYPFVEQNQQFPAIDSGKNRPFIEKYYENNTYNTI